MRFLLDGEPVSERDVGTVNILEHLLTQEEVAMVALSVRVRVRIVGCTGRPL